MDPTTNDITFCRACCGWRPVDWRWRLALGLLDRPRTPFRKHADDGVKQALAFERAYRRCQNDKARERLAKRQPELYRARELYYSEPPHPRWAVEARILAREPVADIAKQHDLTPEVIDRYAPIFFDVADRLDNASVIQLFVIGPKVYTGWSPTDDLDVIWRYFGYHYGPKVLDRLIALSSDPHWMDNLECPDKPLDRDTREVLRLKMAVAAQMALTPYTLKKVLELWLKLREKDRQAKDDAHLRAAMKHIRLNYPCLFSTDAEATQTTEVPPAEVPAAATDAPEVAACA
jgi:hypothetical protein